MLNDQSITSPHNEPQRYPGFAQKQPQEKFCKKGVLKKFRKFHRKTFGLESLCNNVAGLQTLIFPMKFSRVLRSPILKNICERPLLFVSPQNTVTNSIGEFGLDQISTKCKASIFLNVRSMDKTRIAR